MRMTRSHRWWRAALLPVVFVALLLPAEGGAAGGGEEQDVPEIGPLPPREAPDANLAELGKYLFFDEKLSGDATLSCATCHDPQKGWGDGLALSLAYPGSKYFRNAKTLLNSVYARYFYWDGRLTGADKQTMVRDSITESHFLNLDGRIMLERLKQVPEYVEMFNQTQGGEPSFGRALNAVAAFLETVVSKNVPFDEGKRDTAQTRGLELFRGKAGCIRCHNGPYFSDGRAHAIGAPENPDVLGDPMRHFTMRSFFKFMGVAGFEVAREDVGYFVVTKENPDRGKFLTPTLRELTRTAPYMHNGMLPTLDEVVEFYDRGGGDAPNKDPLLVPLGLTDQEKQELMAFLRSLSGDEVVVARPDIPEYQLIADWLAVEN